MTEQKKGGLLYLIANVCSNIAGTGALITLIPLAKNGSISILALLVTAGVSLCFAYCFAQLSLQSTADAAAHSPFYKYTHLNLGVLPAKVTSTLYFVSNVATNILLSIFIAKEIQHLLLDNQVASAYAVPLSICITMMMLTITMLNLRANAAGWLRLSVMGAFTIKLGLLILIMVLGCLRFRWTYLVANFNLTGLSHWQALKNGIGIISFCLLGMESGDFLIKIAQNPRENVPKAMVLGTGLAVIFYTLILLALLGSLPSSSLLNAVGSVPTTLLSQFTSNLYYKTAIRSLVIAACYGGLNAWIFNACEAARFLSKDLSGHAGEPQTAQRDTLMVNVTYMIVTLAALIFGLPGELVLNMTMLLYLSCFALTFIAYLRSVWGRDRQVPWRYWSHVGIGVISSLSSLYYLTIVGGDIVRYFV